MEQLNIVTIDYLHLIAQCFFLLSSYFHWHFHWHLRTPYNVFT